MILGCLFAILGAVAPRIALVLLWIFTPAVNLAFGGAWLWPLLGLIFLPFTTLILTLYFRGLPPEIDEAAQVEGASPWRVLKDITIPLALPTGRRHRGRL